MEGPADTGTAAIIAAGPDAGGPTNSTLEGTRGPRANTMTDAANGKARFSATARTAGDFPHSLPGSRTEVVVFDDADQMVQTARQP